MTGNQSNFKSKKMGSNNKKDSGQPHQCFSCCFHYSLPHFSLFSDCPIKFKPVNIILHFVIICNLYYILYTIHGNQFF